MTCVGSVLTNAVCSQPTNSDVAMQMLQSLSTYKLTPQQAADISLDLLTGIAHDTANL